MGDPLIYRVATLADCQALCKLVNSAYRGESSYQGWTTEADYLDGQRIDIEMLTDMITDPNTVVLLFLDRQEETLVGCAYLKHAASPNHALLGMLTVRPDLQSRGYGKFILSIAEDYALNRWNIEYIEMTVVTIRTELLAYYNRRGYVDSGRREPFPIHDPKFGLPKRTDLEFCVMTKDFRPNKH